VADFQQRFLSWVSSDFSLLWSVTALQPRSSFGEGTGKRSVSGIFTQAVTVSMTRRRSLKYLPTTWLSTFDRDRFASALSDVGTRCRSGIRCRATSSVGDDIHLRSRHQPLNWFPARHDFVAKQRDAGWERSVRAKADGESESLRNLPRRLQQLPMREQETRNFES